MRYRNRVDRCAIDLPWMLTVPVAETSVYVLSVPIPANVVMPASAKLMLLMPKPCFASTMNTN